MVDHWLTDNEGIARRAISIGTSASALLKAWGQRNVSFWMNLQHQYHQEIQTTGAVLTTGERHHPLMGLNDFLSSPNAMMELNQCSMLEHFMHLCGLTANSILPCHHSGNLRPLSVLEKSDS